MAIFSILSRLIFFAAFCTAIPFHNQSLSPGSGWPNSYIALGDSYASGVGAGHYIHPYNNEIKRCKRFDGSYPSQVNDLLGVQQFDFVACTGDVLDNLNDQHNKLGNKRADLVTLSIVGNDFLFGNTVRKCIYNYFRAGPVGPREQKRRDNERDKQCQEALRMSRNLVEGGLRNDKKSVWTRYEEEVDRIISERLSTTNPNAVLIITGYAKFFATPKEDGDVCDGKRFPISNPRVANILHKRVRQEMNDLILQVNTHIRDRIASRHPKQIIFLDTDTPLDNHRFCEPNPEYQVPGGYLLDSENVYFKSLKTTVLDKEWVARVDNKNQTEIVDWHHESPIRSRNNARTLKSGSELSSRATMASHLKLRVTSIFHPKSQAHRLTALNIQRLVSRRFDSV